MPIPKTINIHEDVRPLVEDHERTWRVCNKCFIANWTQHHVFFRGTVPCDILFVGEGPGKEEDRIGLPFQGAAGSILQKWIDTAIEDIPFTYAITNTVCCRPTNKPRGSNRPPTTVEQARCSSRLDYFVNEIAKPKGIVLLGKVAQENDIVSQMPLPLLYLYHPAYYIYSGKLWRPEVEKLVSFAMEVMP